MKLLANENIPGVAVAALAAGGHDVIWVRTAAPGMADTDVRRGPREKNGLFSPLTRILANLRAMRRYQGRLA
jgi:hypothetical protein